ncbi:MAG: hypothetical protein AAFQ05_15965, partial [Pseudomonadota bacterium]
QGTRQMPRSAQNGQTPQSYKQYMGARRADPMTFGRGMGANFKAGHAFIKRMRPKPFQEFAASA